MERERILIIEDNQNLLNQLKWALQDEYDVLSSDNGDNITPILNEKEPNLVLLDLCLPPYIQSSRKGFEILQYLIENNYEGKVIIITGSQDIKDSLLAVDLGVFDYLSKPLNIEELKTIIRRGLYLHKLEKKNRHLRKKTKTEYSFAGIIGKSTQIRSIFCFLKRVSHTETTVLIRGESGTGKELIARALHAHSSRREGRFVTINCAAIPSDLLETELFGHEKGAFTGAIGRKLGKIELAQNGTVFLDEIGDLSPILQVKILRFLQEKEIERVGGMETIKINTRIIAATNKNLETAMQQGIFREDLYWRLKEITIELPPLRERGEDVLLLADYFMERFCKENNIKQKVLSRKARASLIRHSWPGNIRELEHRVNMAITLSPGRIITEKHLDLQHEGTLHYDTLKEIRELTEKEAIIKALKKNNYNISRTGRELGVDRKVLRRRMQRYGITKPEAGDK